MSDSPENPALRIDKWLWAARFFKTRGLATTAIDGGKVHVNGQRVKPSRAIRPGDEIEITRDRDAMTVIVQDISDRRGPAPVAQTLYTETQASQTARAQAAEQRRLQRDAVGALRPQQRPNKKDRRELRRLVGRE